MTSDEWLVVGIAGATCSGKTMLSKRLAKNLENLIIIQQDEYFFPRDDPRHTLVPEINHRNFELLTSLDMPRMIGDIKKIFESSALNNVTGNEKTKILILDGFLLFNCHEIVEFCDMRYFLDVHKNVCHERRKRRVYASPEVPAYFDKIVWPEFIKSKSELLADKELSKSIKFIDASSSHEETFTRVLGDIKKRLSM